ncbi:MAG: porin family protein [Solirubrobacteraceae bacterium]
MKTKLIIISVMSLLTITKIYGQTESPRTKLDFGIKAGTNISNVWDSKGEEFAADSKFGFAGGVFLGVPLGEVLGLQPEVLISQKGFKGSGSLLGLPYSFSRTTTYLDIPLLVQIKPADFITLVAGPQFSYLLSQKDVYTFADNSADQEQEFENDNIRKNILGIVGGADLYYQNFLFSGRLGWDFQTNNGDGTSDTPRYKNQWLQFMVGYKF